MCVCKSVAVGGPFVHVGPDTNGGVSYLLEVSEVVSWKDGGGGPSGTGRLELQAVDEQIPADANLGARRRTDTRKIDSMTIVRPYDDLVEWRRVGSEIYLLDIAEKSSQPQSRDPGESHSTYPRRDDLTSDHIPPTQLHQPTTQIPVSQPESTSNDQGSFVTLSPSISPHSSLSSSHSTPTIRVSQNHSSPYHTSNPNQKAKSNILRPLSFFRRSHLPSPTHSPIPHSASLPASRDTSPTSLARASSSVPNSPVTHTSKLPRISAEDILTLGTISFFRARSGSASSNRPPRPPSPPHKLSQERKLPQRSASTESTFTLNSGSGKCNQGNHHTSNSSGQSVNSAISGSGTKKRRASSSAFTPGAGGGRHIFSSQMLSSATNASGAPPLAMKSSPLAPQKPHVRMLNGRIYGGKRYAAQTLANPFANVRDEPEFVEWGYGGMGSVQASAGIASDMWRGLQRGERGGALLAGSSFSSSSPSTSAKEVKPAIRTQGTNQVDGDVMVGGGRGSGAHVRSPASRRRIMSDDVSECGMGSVGASGGADEEDGSGMGWVKRRRAEREAKARLEQETMAHEEKEKEGRKSGDSGTDANMSTSTMSTSASLTTSTSVSATTTSVVTTPATSPFASRSTSLTDFSLASSPVECSTPSSPDTATSGQSHALSLTRDRFPTSFSNPPAHPVSTPKDELHVRTAVRRDHDKGEAEGDAPSSPVDTLETTTGASSSSEEEARVKRDSDEEEEQDDDEDEEGEARETARKTALGAGVEKVSRHMDAEDR
ncbi:hypothetical protein BS17DRAFT_763426 [Gyrodon lividus]|nr:hypothetical protein BS17DRAFT_763426 [Gyrodon lividus]